MTEQLRLSWSRIRLHEECPEKGKHIAAGRRSKVADYRTFFPGTVTDRCMRRWLEQEHPEPGWMAAQVARVMDEEEAASRDNGDGIVKWRHASDRAEVRASCIKAVTRLEADLRVLLNLDGEPHDWQPAPRFEVPIALPRPDGTKVQILLTGEIDLLVRTPVGLEVWDLKTTRDDQYWRKCLGQLLFYEIAMWGQGHGWAVRSGLLQPLCAETMPEFRFTADDRLAMFQRIQKVAFDILDGRLDPKPQPGCKYCDVRHACSVKGGGRGRVPLGPG